MTNQYPNININFPISSRTINTSTTLNQDDNLVIVDTSGAVGPPTITLPDAREVDSKIITIKVPIANTTSGGQNVIINGVNSQTIDENASLTISANQTAISFQSDNSNWRTVSSTTTSSTTGGLPVGFYNAADYITDAQDTSAIQRAVDDASSTTNGGTVIIPAGDWAFSEQVVVPNHVHITGAGSRATQITGSASVPIFLLGTDSYSISPVHNQISLQKVRIEGAFTGGGVLVSSVQNAYLGDLDIRCGGTPAPFGIKLTNECRYTLVERCDIRSVDWCVRIEDGFRSCRLFMSRFRCTGDSTRNGVFMGGGPNAGGSNTVMEFCEVAGFGGIGVHIDGSTNPVDRPIIKECRLESAQPGTPPAIQTDGTVLNPYGLNNYFGSGASVTNVIDNSDTFTALQYGALEDEIRYIDNFQPGNFRRIFTGTGDPNNVVVGSPGDIYTNVSGGAGTTLYIKESGTTTDTGWVAK